MTKANYGEEMEKAKKSGGTSEWFKISEGENRMRLLTTSSIYPKHFSKTGYKGICIGGDNDCPGCKEGSQLSIRHLVWILDRKDSKMKLFEMPHKAFQQVVAYQKDADWAFEDVPMPYDIKLNAKNAGDTSVVYTIIPAKFEPLSESELEEVAKLTPTDIIIEKMKDKEKKTTVGATVPSATSTSKVEYPEESINLDDIPF